MKNFRLYLLSFFISLFFNAFAQHSSKISGTITDAKGEPIELATIQIEESTQGTITDKKGFYSLDVPANQEINIVFSFIGFEKKSIKIILKQSENKIVNIQLEPLSTLLAGVEIKADQVRTSTITRIDPKISNKIPSISGGVEDIIKTLPGVSSNNELSTQYSVRGGNFDENLVYVNGIEIYRPFLVRSGQQEGLSFVNSDLVSSISFSAGGFDAKYGDKMSSVLDITYKKPSEFAASVSLGLLGSQAHVEGISKNNRISYLLGFRYKSNNNLLNGLDTKGDYKPFFYDFQTLISYELSQKWELSFLGNYANNTYKLIPSNRETSFGTINDSYNFKIYFDGQEIDKFETTFGALTAKYKNKNNLNLQFIASAFQTIESETYDIQGQYWIGRLDANSGSGLDDVIETQGVGTHLNHARNYLEATVLSFEHKGSKLYESQIIEWGLKFQHEKINDKLNEWEMVDSSAYSIPNPIDLPGDPNPNHDDFIIYNSLKSNANLISNRVSGFAQSKWFFNPRITLTAGLRFNYWDYNNEFLVSPRTTFSYKPDWENDIVFRFSTGFYYQSPFYKELRDLDGVVLNNIKAQKSIHFVAGADWNFKLWNRPFKLVSEFYYKHLENLIPYKIDNVRIRYLPHLSSKGYAAGIDLKINGEFVEGVESWASLSIMQTQEDIQDDFYIENYNASGDLIIPAYTEDDIIVSSKRIEPGYIPRPTDQRFNFSLFFQDYLPHNPSYKMHLRLVYGSRLPFGPPDSEKYQDVLRIPPYRRVDIGFSKQLIGEKTSFSSNSPFRFFKSLWITAEVLNLLQINNTVSYLWVKDIHSRQYAIPNYLTERQLNFKLIATF